MEITIYKCMCVYVYMCVCVCNVIINYMIYMTTVNECLPCSIFYFCITNKIYFVIKPLFLPNQNNYVVRIGR